MKTTPIAMLMRLAQRIVCSRRGQAHTHRTEIDDAGDGDDPDVHGIDDVTTVELVGRLILDTWASDLSTGLTKRPSANQLFRRNMRLQMILIGLE